MNLEELAQKIYVERKEANERVESGNERKEVVEKLVWQILEIFNISNKLETSTILVWGVKISKVQDGGYCNTPEISLRPDNWSFSNTSVFGENCNWLGDNSRLVEHIRKVQIPSIYYEEIADYFHIYLSGYFNITEKVDGGSKQLLIKLKEPVNVEEIKGIQEYIEKYFPIVKASSLSLKDEFLKHEPKTDRQERFKKQLISAIKSGLSDFRAQRMDACFDEEGNICFKAGMKLKVRKSPNWWKKAAKEFMPEKESRLGTTKERIAFLGLIIKYLIEEKGYTVSDAWKAVCDQSKDLGHYRDSENAKHDFEDTGSRQVGEWYDLANTFKFIIDDESGDVLLVGGDCNRKSYNCPLAGVFSVNLPFHAYYDGVGWIVLSV